MNIENMLSMNYAYREIGKKEILTALTRGYITVPGVNTILNSVDVLDETLDDIKKHKLAELSYLCHLSIENGFNIELSDSKVYHFSLTSKDQINLMSKMIEVTVGKTSIEYHSDGQLAQYFSASDMKMICDMAQYKISINTTYYNCLSQWVKDCTSIDDVKKINYGVSIPEEYWTDPWRHYNELSDTVQEVL